QRPQLDFLMIRSDGTAKPVYYGFSVLNEIFSTPEILYARDEGGVAIVAGKSTDGRRINIIASFYDRALADSALRGDGGGGRGGLGSREAEIVLENLPLDSVAEGVEIKRYVVDDEKNIEMVESTTVLKKDVTDKLPLAFKATVPSVVHLQVTIK
ncbi:MAG TPA: hypothetical protein VJM57_06105, partial [Thermodesulfobacteriota bacterium]|nr:hypothetical protein [Thermodesulfobacteriota bacterium]